MAGSKKKKSEPSGPDLYAELSVAKNASTEEIKKAYRRLALQCHPDKNPGDAAAHERFQKISVAYSVLSDDGKRRYYDQTGTTEGLDISPDEFMDMFQSLLLEIVGGADMIRDMLSCFTPRELARLPPFPFPKELFPPGTFPEGLRFSSKGLKGMPPQEWIAAARGGDVGALCGMLAASPGLLGARCRGMGHTALHWAAAKGEVEGVEWLLRQGLDVNVRNGDGATPLHAAARNGRMEQKQRRRPQRHLQRRTRLSQRPSPHVLLLPKGQGTSLSFTAHSALHWAVAKGHLHVARWLLEQGADPDALNASDAAPLHTAAGQGAADCARLLVLEAGARMGLANELELLARVAAMRDAPGGEADWAPRAMRTVLAAAGISTAGMLERQELVAACRQLIASNRAAAYCGMSYFGKGQADAEEAVRLDPGQPKYRCRRGPDPTPRTLTYHATTYVLRCASHTT
eukprot:XP_001701016.1 DnaJ-like protein [Chlamydomonas reinhardtii]